MNNNLNKKNIFITGALGLLGAEFVKSILEAGGNPILIDIDFRNHTTFVMIRYITSSF